MNDKVARLFVPLVERNKSILPIHTRKTIPIAEDRSTFPNPSSNNIEVEILPRLQIIHPITLAKYLNATIRVVNQYLNPTAAQSTRRPHLRTLETICL